ncbi:MAG TPA: RhuM family protein [bacterium]|nr:RhuM family protein [bacterium]HRQ70986.1 RhuM family protein [bacterium]
MQNQIIIYQPEVGLSSLEVRLENETVWLTQNQMAELFDKNRKTITEHINNIYKELELQRDSTSRKFQLVQKEGEREIVREIEHYNLDVIISVGYRVKSKRRTQFRIWANKVLKEYLMKGYALNQRIEQIEEKTVYHIGGSLKDLGKKLFAFSRIEINPQIILNYLLES